MTIPTERSLNRMIYPVVEKSKAKREFPVEIRKDNSKRDCTSLFTTQDTPSALFSIDNYWDQKSFMIMDIITYKITTAVFGKFNKLRDIQKQANRKTHKEVNEIIDHGDQQIIGIRREELMQLPYFKTVSNNNILKIIKRMSECRFSGYYEYRYYDERMDKFNHEKSIIKQDKIIDDVVRDGNLFNIYMSSKLAKLYILNITQMNIDFMPMELYKLGKYPQLLYRFIASNNRSKNKGNIKLNINEIAEKIDIYVTNPSRSIWLIDNYLSELYENNLITEYSISNNLNNKYTKKQSSINTFVDINV